MDNIIVPDIHINWINYINNFANFFNNAIYPIIKNIEINMKSGIHGPNVAIFLTRTEKLLNNPLILSLTFEFAS